MLHLLVNKCKCRHFKLKEQIQRFYEDLTLYAICKYRFYFSKNPEGFQFKKHKKTGI